MAIDIKDRETEALLDEVRTATGKEVGDILRGLARQEAERLRREREFEERVRRIDEISNYDDWGLPT